jgi:hypothetical protein
MAFTAHRFLMGEERSALLQNGKESSDPRLELDLPNEAEAITMGDWAPGGHVF